MLASEFNGAIPLEDANISTAWKITNRERIETYLVCDGLHPERVIWASGALVWDRRVVGTDGCLGCNGGHVSEECEEDENEARRMHGEWGGSGNEETAFLESQDGFIHREDSRAAMVQRRSVKDMFQRDMRGQRTRSGRGRERRAEGKRRGEPHLCCAT